MLHLMHWQKEVQGHENIIINMRASGRCDVAHRTQAICYLTTNRLTAAASRALIEDIHFF